MIPISGSLAGAEAPTAEAGAAAPDVTGTFAIQRFARTQENAVAAVGTLTLTFTDPSTSSMRTIITQAAMPLVRSTDTAAPTQAADRTASSAPSASTAACETVRLVLDAIAIAPLGVSVQIARVNVDVTAMPGLNERLAALLCDVTSQINGSAAPADLVTSLNAILDMLG